MAVDTAQIIQGIIIGIAVSVGTFYVNKQLSKPETITAEVLATPFSAPPSTTGPLAQAACLVNVLVRNDTRRPVKQLRVLADFAVAYVSAPNRRQVTTGAIAKPETAFTIEALDPGATRRVFVFTTLSCAYHDERPMPHPGVRVFNDEGSAEIRDVIPPSGYMISVNEYWFATYPLLIMGLLMFALVALAAIIDLGKAIKKASSQS